MLCELTATATAVVVATTVVAVVVVATATADNEEEDYKKNNAPAVISAFKTITHKEQLLKLMYLKRFVSLYST